MSNIELGDLPEKDRETIKVNRPAEEGRESNFQLPAGMTTEMPEKFKLLRERIRREIPDRREGLNTPRVEDFVRSQGLSLSEYLIFDEESSKQLSSILTSEGFRPVDVEHLGGRHYPELQLCTIRRFKEYEEVGGPINIERNMVHELAHASSAYNLYLEDGGYHGMRVGFSSDKGEGTGYFLEEGFAEMLAAEYVKQNVSTADEDKMAETLGSDARFDSLDIVAEIRNEKGETMYKLPLKYFLLGTKSHAMSSPAGFAMEMLCKQNPKLWPAIIKSRTSAEGLREVARNINEIDPSLYEKLRAHLYDTDGFQRGLHDTVKAIGGWLD